MKLKVYWAWGIMGLPLAAVQWLPAALAVLNLIAADGLFETVETLGARLEFWLHELTLAAAAGDVRRLGLMAAVDLNSKDAHAVVDAARAEGILLNATSSDTLRMLPALIV